MLTGASKGMNIMEVTKHFRIGFNLFHKMQPIPGTIIGLKTYGQTTHKS